MSGPIRKLVGPARARLQNYIEEASSILLGSLDDKNAEEEEIRLDELVIRIKTTCGILERCNTDWSNLLKDLKGEEKAKEEKEFQRFTEGGDGYLEVFLDANETVSRLESRQRRVVKEIQE